MPSPQPKKQSLFRFFLPLILCGLFVLGLIGYRQHKVFSERTRIKFSISLPGKSSVLDASVKLDGKPVSSGQIISLGSHTLTVTHPKADLFQTNFFAWYGGRDFSQIELRRLSGHLNVSSSVPATTISIEGKDFSTVLQNISETNLPVPADSYQVRAEYPHGSQTKTADVADNMTAACVFDLQFGVLTLTCNFENAVFRLADDSGKNVESGVTPATVTSLPVGAYRLVVTSHRNQLIKDFTVKVNETNNVACEFVLGAVQFVTMPPGASVRATEGSNLGKTPLLLTDQQPQTNSFTLEMSGYESTTVSVEITGAQTNFIQTNLVSLAYANAMRSAQNYLTAGDFERAAAEIKNALIAKPDDSDALKLQTDASIQFGIKKARSLAAAGNYIEGSKVLSNVLVASPENDVAKGLLADYKQRASVQIDRQNSERLSRPKKVFDAVLAQSDDASLFEAYEIKSTKPAKDLELAIKNALQSGQPPFNVVSDTSPESETFSIAASQEFSTALATSAGKRQVFIVVGQSKDDETQIYFKVLEYKTEAVNKFSIGALINAPVAVNYVPLNASRVTMTDAYKARIAEGIQIINERIHQATGE